jgi:predicted transcriptional regulator
MTGRELILYILQNHLEDEPVVKDGKLVGFMSVDEVASKFNVGAATVTAWIDMGFIIAVQIGNALYIPDIYERCNG